MKKIFVAVGSTASDAVIELATRCRAEGLDSDGKLAQDFKYITIDTDRGIKERLEGLYPDRTRVCGIHITHEKDGSSVLNSLLAVREDWKGKLTIDPYGAYGYRYKLAGTRKWVEPLRQIFKTWKIADEEKVEILLVGTACGATSTGMYWDVAGWLRAQSNTASTVCGVVCLPDLDEKTTTPDGRLYPIPRNFCSFMQDMRQIAILNSLRNGHKDKDDFRPISFREIDGAEGARNWEDCTVSLMDEKDIRRNENRLPIDAMFFLPPPLKDATASFADHLFTYASIYHFTETGGVENVGNGGERGGIFGGLYLAVAQSPLSGEVKKRVQERWQSIRSSFLASGDTVPMNKEEQETIAAKIRPPDDLFPTALQDKIQDPQNAFELWKRSVSDGKRPPGSAIVELRGIAASLRSRIEAEAFPAYVQAPPIPLKFLGKASFLEKIKENAEVWELVVSDKGVQATIHRLKAVYMMVCDEIKSLGGKTTEELDRKAEAMIRAMDKARETFETASKRRKTKMAVKVFGQAEEIQKETATSFEKWADAWFVRLSVIFLMHKLAESLPSREQVEAQITSFSNLISDATTKVDSAGYHPTLDGRISVSKKDVLEVLFDKSEGKGLATFDEGKEEKTIKEKYGQQYDSFVRDQVAANLDRISKTQTFDMTPFTPSFHETINGFSSVFKRENRDQQLVKHIFKHAGKIQKPTNKTVGEFSPSFMQIEDACNANHNDPYDPFAKDGQTAGEITEAPDKDKRECYFGKFGEEAVPNTFLGMWLGVLAMDKSLPELMSQIYSAPKREAIQIASMSAETGTTGREADAGRALAGTEFWRLMNLRESVELGVVLGFLKKKFQEWQNSGQGVPAGMHLKRKGDKGDLVTWTPQEVSKFSNPDGDGPGAREKITIRTLRKLLTWLRELYADPELREIVQFWNDKDWIPLTDETFMFDRLPAYETALKRLETYLGGQLEVAFDRYVAG